MEACPTPRSIWMPRWPWRPAGHAWRPAAPILSYDAWDGSGYPRQLRGEAIPLAARLFAVIAIWEALRSGRPPRRAWPEGKAIEYIRQQSGQQLDPRVVRAFIKLWEDGGLIIKTTAEAKPPV